MRELPLLCTKDARIRELEAENAVMKERLERSITLYDRAMRSLESMRSTGVKVSPMVVWQKLEPIGHQLRAAIDGSGADGGGVR